MAVNVHLYPSPLLHETRMERICRFIAGTQAFSRIEMIGVGRDGLPTVEMRQGYLIRRLPRWQPPGPVAARKAVQTIDWSRRVLRTLWQEDVRCVNSHSLAMLPLGVLLKWRHGARLIYDAHELETEVATARGAVRVIYKAIERLLIRQCDGVVVVSDSIADWYLREYGIGRPTVVRNVPDAPADGLPAANPNLWRGRFGIPSDHLVFIYQGGLSRGRRIEQLIRVFAVAKPDRHVVFMGYGELETVVREAAERYANIHFAPAVRPDEVLRHTAGADVGLVGVENVCLSYYYSLPNKLFEFLLAGIPAIMPDFPEMKRVAAETGCGWVVGEEDAAWLAMVNGIEGPALAAAKACARQSAASFSWREEERSLSSLYRAVQAPAKTV